MGPADTPHHRPRHPKQLQELEIDLAEHELVANQLKLLDGGRKAFRLVGGVLMERTVGDVLPELTSTAEMVRSSMDGGVVSSQVASIAWIDPLTALRSLLPPTAQGGGEAVRGGAGEEAARDGGMEGKLRRAGVRKCPCRCCSWLVLRTETEGA